MERQTISKRVLWRDREGRLQLSIWEFTRVYSSRVERAAVLSAGDRPGVWLSLGEIAALRALLDRLDAPITQRHSLDHVAEEATALISLPEEERVATDQRVLQFARVLEAGLRFRQEPPTDACTRAAWASAGHKHIIAIAEQLTNRASPDPDHSGLATTAAHDTSRYWRAHREQYGLRVVSMQPYSPGYARRMRRRPYEPRQPQYAVRHINYAARR